MSHKPSHMFYAWTHALHIIILHIIFISILEREVYVLNYVFKRNDINLYLGKRSICTYVLKRESYRPILEEVCIKLMF